MTADRNRAEHFARSHDKGIVIGIQRDGAKVKGVKLHPVEEEGEELAEEMLSDVNSDVAQYAGSVVGDVAERLDSAAKVDSGEELAAKKAEAAVVEEVDEAVILLGTEAVSEAKQSQLVDVIDDV